MWIMQLLYQRDTFQSHLRFLCLKMADSTSAVKPKQKRTVLSIEDKVAIIKQLESSSANVIAERYGVGKSMVSDIKKNRDKILCFNQEMCDMGMSKKVKVRRSEMTNSTTRPCTCGSSKSEWRAYPSQARYCVKSCPAAQEDVW